LYIDSTVVHKAFVKAPTNPEKEDYTIVADIKIMTSQKYGILRNVK